MEAKLKELRGNSAFPFDTRRPLSAVDMALDTGRGNRFVFGMNREAVAAMLRTLADEIESGVCILQSGAVTSKVTGDEYATTYFTLKVHETLVKK